MMLPIPLLRDTCIQVALEHFVIPTGLLNQEMANEATMFFGRTTYFTLGLEKSKE